MYSIVNLSVLSKVIGKAGGIDWFVSVAQKRMLC